MGVKEAPGKDGSRHKNQAEDLVAPEDALLPVTLSLLVLEGSPHSGLR